MQRHPLHTQHGFTLIEMFVALVVLAIALLGMSRASVSMITVHTANERLAHASALLQDRMETLKRSGYGGAATVSSTETYRTNSPYSTYKNGTTVAGRSPPPPPTKTNRPPPPPENT